MKISPPLSDIFGILLSEPMARYHGVLYLNNGVTELGWTLLHSKCCRPRTFTTDVQNVCSLQGHKLQERVYREKIGTVEEFEQRITGEWERLDQHVIDNAVKQCISASMLVSLLLL